MIGDATSKRFSWGAVSAESTPSGSSTPTLARLESDRPQGAWKRWVRSAPPLIWVALLVISTFVLAGILATVVAPHDPLRNDLMARLQPPAFINGGSTTHLLGTDQLGRDLLSRLIYGARVSLAIAVLGTFFGAILGALCGLVSGFARGRLDSAMMLLVDAYIALPFMIVALSVVAVFGSSIWVLTMLAAFSGWAGYTRVMRGQALQAREEQYVLAARASGAGPGRLLLRHLLPNVLAPMIVLTTFELTGIILLEASLSFLGFGVQPPTPAWGLMVSEGREYLNTAWWIGLFPGLVIMLIAISVSLLGDWLRDMLDPKLRSR